MSGDEQPIDVSDDLGFMLFDIDFVPDAKGKVSYAGHDAEGRSIVRGDAQPKFFRVRLEKGVLRVPQEMYEGGRE